MPSAPVVADRLKSAPIDERRRSKRVPHVIQAFVVSPTATRADEREEVTSIDLSRHGVSFDHKRPLPVGAYYVIEIGLGEQRLVSEVHTISCRATAEGKFQIGAEFC